MPRIEVYATQSCPFCIAARRLLDGKSAPYELIDVGAEPGRRAEMTKRAEGRRSVPQIFIDGVHVGGSDELHQLDRAGKLDPWLATSA